MSAPGPGADPLAELRRLEREARGAPWAADGCGVVFDTGTATGGEPTPEVALIAAMRNALPRLLDVAEAARAYYTAWWDDSSESENEARARLSVALKNLEAK